MIERIAEPAARNGGRLALTVWPEWAWAIAHFGRYVGKERAKNIENRVWPVPDHMVGQWCAIHAGKYIGGRKGDNALLEGLTDLREMAENVAEEFGDDRIGGGLPEYSELIPLIATSAVVAVVRLGETICLDEPKGWHIGPETLDRHGRVVKNYGWPLNDVRTLVTPVPCKGAQGLWPLSADVLAAVRAQLQPLPAAGRGDE
jgi:hypothetical protein